MRIQNRVVLPGLCCLALTWCGACSSGEATESPNLATDATTFTPEPAAEARVDAVVPATESGDWPNWGGPTFDLNLRLPGLQTDWPKAGLPIVWTREIGIGFSSMSTSGERLMAMGHKDGKESVWCLNAQTGEVNWEHSYPCRLIDNLHEGGPCSTPTIDGSVVYTLGKEGQLFCLSLSDGSVIWQKDLRKDLEVKVPEWGFSSSPRIVGPQLILEGGRVVSYNKTTGAKLWQTELHEAGYGSAAVFENAGRTLLATLDCDGLRILNAADGSEIAFREWKSPYKTNSTTPIIIGETVFVSTGYKVGCGMFRFRGDSLEEIYVNHAMHNHFSNSVLHEGHFYGFDGDSHASRNVTLTCIEAETGKSVWKQRGLGCGSLMLVDGRLLALSDKGELVLAEASPEAYTEHSRSVFLDGRCWTVPIVSGGRVYGRNAAGKLVCAELPWK